MAAIIIDNDNSIDETVASQALSSSAGGSLTVATDGFVMASGATGVAVNLSHPSTPWTVTVNGTVAATPSAGGGMALGIFAPGISKVTVGETGSIYTTGNGVYCAGSLSLTNAGLIEAGTSYAVYAETSSNTVKNSGTIKNDGSAHLVEFFGGGKNSVTNSGTIAAGGGAGAGNAIQSANGTSDDTVTNTGTIVGDVFLGAGKNTLTNSKEIWGDVGMGDGDDKITNSGAIQGDVVANWGKNTIVNSGTVTNIFAGIHDDKITNAKGGTVSGTVDAGNGNNTITNDGKIVGDLLLGTGNDVLTVKGEVRGAVTLGEGNNTLTNAGLLSEANISGVTAGAGNDKVTSSGTIHHALSLGDGANVVANSGKIDGPVSLGSGNDVVTNSGEITGALVLGDGANTVSMTSGKLAAILGGTGVDTLTIGGEVSSSILLGDGNDKITFTGNGHTAIAGSVDLGKGDDSYIGNGLDEWVIDSDGSDKIALGAGIDTFEAFAGLTPGFDGLDEIDGGAGLSDYYNAHSASGDLLVNLGTADFTHAAVGTLAKSQATGTDIGTDKILSFEDVAGGTGHDTIVGSAAANFISGHQGADYLFGLAGNDTIYGGGDAFKDRIWGGLGADILYGSAGLPDGTTDFFFYESIAESTVALKGRDTIMDFETGTDKVNLSNIADHNTKLAGAQDFNWLGFYGQFTGAGGELRYMHAGSDLTILYGDTNGDKKADFAISFKGQLALSASDFQL